MRLGARQVGDMLSQMVDALARDGGTALRLGQHEGALQAGLGEQCQHLRVPRGIGCIKGLGRSDVPPDALGMQRDTLVTTGISILLRLIAASVGDFKVAHFSTQQPIQFEVSFNSTGSNMPEGDNNSTTTNEDCIQGGTASGGGDNRAIPSLPGSMKIHLSAGVTPLPLDASIEAFVREQGDDNPFPGPTRGMAVLNAEGQLYRNHPFGQFRRRQPGGFLRSLGLIDRIGFNQSKLQVVDSLTGQPLATRRSGVFQQGDQPHPIPAIPRQP